MDKKKTRFKVKTIAENCLAVRLRLVNRAISGIYDDLLRPFGVKVSQMNILVLVANRGNVRPGEIGKILVMDKSTVSRNVDRMIARGWLVSKPDEDGRGVQIRISDSGLKLLEKTYPVWKKAQEKAEALLGKAAVSSINGVAERLWSRSGK